MSDELVSVENWLHISFAECDCIRPGIAKPVDYLYPHILYGDQADFQVGIPLGAQLLAAVEAEYWLDCPGYGIVYCSEQQARFDAPWGDVTLALMPNTTNCIRFRARHPEFGLSPPVDFLIESRATISLIPASFLLSTLKIVTDEELNEELQRMIAESSKVSKELAKFLKDHVQFWDGEDSVTGKIDPNGPNTPENTRIRISRKQWRDALAAYKDAEDADKPGIREDLLRQFLSQLLHEANHRKGIVDGVSKPTIPEEEKRNTEDLIARLIALLEKLKTHLPGQPEGTTAKPLDDGDGLAAEDAATWIARIREIIHIQKVYRFQRAAPSIEPWKTKYNKVKRAWRTFKDKLKQIREDGSKNQEQKAAAADQAYNEFKDSAGQDKADLERDFDVKWDLDWEHDSLQPKEDLSSTNIYQGHAIPN